MGDNDQDLGDDYVQSQINDTDPKQIVRAAFELLKILPPRLTNMSIYIGDLPGGVFTQNESMLHVTRESGDTFDLSDEAGEIGNIKIRNVGDLFKYIKNETISIIELSGYDINGAFANQQIVLFRCDHRDCYDMKRWAATKIQSKVRGGQARNRYYSPYTDIGKARLLSEFETFSRDFNKFGSSKNDIAYLRKLI
jgi:hypothetical protein